jgi:hypothetical protein
VRGRWEGGSRDGIRVRCKRPGVAALGHGVRDGCSGGGGRRVRHHRNEAVAMRGTVSRD